MSEEARTTKYITAWAAQLVREAREDVAEIKPWFVRDLADQLEAAMLHMQGAAGTSEVITIETEKLRRIQAELRRTQEREFALIAERTALRERLEKQAKWLAWPQYGQVGAAAALRRALVEACDVGLSWSGSDTRDGRRLRELKDFALRSLEDLAQEEGAREESGRGSGQEPRGVGPFREGTP